MSTRKVYADFQDGNSYIDISDYVGDTLTVSLHGFNDSYKSAQNECSFDVVYDTVIYPLFRNATKDILVKVVDVIEDSLLLTESQEAILTESKIELAVDTGTAIPIFTGHIPLTHARTYNGLLNNTTLSFTAQDNLSYFDVEVGDVVFTNCKVYDAADTDNSIVHKLAAIAGWDVSKSTQEYKITTVLAKFAPDSETDHVGDIIDTLLHEYGYAFNLDAADNIAPILWNVSSDVVSDYVFNEDNIIQEVSVTDSVNQYDGATVTYYELGTANKVRLYRDSNCSYDDDNTLAGFTILSGYTYPPETNTIDPTTSTNQVVYQEYTDDAITYKTNYAVVADLGYNYSAFSSDFSAIVATADHFVDRKYDTGITVEREEFGNKKCRLVYSNTSGTAKKLYYNDVYGSVWYKSSERKVKVNLVTTPSNPFQYTMKYVFSPTIAESYTKARISQYQEGATTYKFLAEVQRDIGTVCAIQLNDGTNQLTIIRDRSWDEKTQQYTYQCRACSVNHSALTAQGVASGTSISTATFSSSVSTSSISIPLANGSSDYSSAWTYMYVYKDGIDVSDSWTFSADATSGITGSFVGNKYVITDMTVSSGTVTLSANRTNWKTQYASIAVSKVIDGASAGVLVATSSSTYLGIGILTSATTAAFTGATVSSAGVITVGGTITPTANSWMINYSSTNVAIGMYIWSGRSWQSTTSVDYISSASDDLCGLTVAGISIPGYTVFMSALIKSLFTKYIKVLTGGSIYGGDRFDSAGNEVNTAVNGFYLNADGTLKANLQSLFRDNIVIGTSAGTNVVNSGSASNYNVFVGSYAGHGVASVSTFYECSFLGYFAGYANTTGSVNSFFGSNSGVANTTGSRNSFFGANSGVTNTTGSHNSFFGCLAGVSCSTYGNCSALGFSTEVTGDNQVQLGNSGTTTYVYGTVQNRSDRRDKADITPEILGLAFINALKPVQFRWNLREDYTIINDDGTVTMLEQDGSKKRNRFHNGFIAQDIKELMDKESIDFGGYQDHSVSGGKDVLSLGYDEFIAPICKAIQELSTEITILKERLDGK